MTRGQNCTLRTYADYDIRVTWVLTGRIDREQWRYTGPFTRYNRFRGLFPGFGIAAVAFTAYCGYEYLFMNKDHHGPGASEHKSGH